MKTLLLVTSFFLLVGCATNAKYIKPMEIDHNQYSSKSCESIYSDIVQKTKDEKALAKYQDQVANDDSIGVFLFLLPVGSMINGDKGVTLSKVRGELVALNKAYSNCKVEPSAIKYHEPTRRTFSADVQIKEYDY